MATALKSTTGKAKPGGPDFDTAQTALDKEARELFPAMSSATTSDERFAIRNAIIAIAEAKKDLAFAKLEQNAAGYQLHTDRLKKNGTDVLAKEKKRLERIGTSIANVAKAVSILDRAINIIGVFV